MTIPSERLKKASEAICKLMKWGNLQLINAKSFRREVRQEYKYDSRGNWTERVVSVRYEINPDSQWSNIERREISYYT